MGVPGNIGDLAFAPQTTKGTPAATALHRVLITGGGIAPTREVSPLEGSTGQRLRQGAFVARARAGGTPSTYVIADMIATLLYGAMGAKAVAGVADPYTHTITLATTQPYFTFWRHIGGILTERFPDCKISQLVLRSAEGQALTVEITIVGLGAHNEDTALVAPALELDMPFVHYDAEQQLLVEGAAIAHMRQVTVTIGTGATVVPGDNLGGYSVAEGLIGIRFETMQLIANAELWNRYHYGAANPADHAPLSRGLLELGGAPAGLDLKWSKRDNAGVAAVPARSLQLQAPRVVLSNITGMETNSNGEPLVATVTYDAYQPVGGASGLTAIVANSLAAITAS